jgi:hypothetical protein
MKLLNKQFGLVAFSAAGMALNANALLLTPGSAGWQGSTPKNPDANALETITGTSAQLTLAYKYNVGGNEGGAFASSYQSAYSVLPTAAQDATVTYGSGSVISGSAIYLLVKDANLMANWYLFNISSWNGTEQIRLDGFFPDKAGISYVGIYSGQSGATRVSDTGSGVALLGLALTSLGLIRRKLGA